MGQMHIIMVTIIGTAIGLFIGQSAGFNSWLIALMAAAAGLATFAFWWYSPMPNSSSLGGGVEGAGYWGFRRSDDGDR